MTETRPHDVAAIKGVLESHYKAWDAGDAAGGISRNSVFQGSEVFAAFGLAAAFR